MTKEPLELELTRSGCIFRWHFFFLLFLFIYSYLFSHLIIVFDLLILFIITSFSSPVPLPIPPSVSWQGDRQGRAAPCQLPRSWPAPLAATGDPPLSRRGRGGPPEGGGLSFLRFFSLRGLQSVPVPEQGRGRGLCTGEGQASRLPCLLRDKRNPSAHPCLYTYSIASEDVGLGPSTSFSPAWGVLGFCVCGRSFIIASKQLALKNIETLVLAPGLCVRAEWGRHSDRLRGGAAGHLTLAGSGLPASRHCGDSDR